MNTANGFTLLIFFNRLKNRQEMDNMIEKVKEAIVERDINELEYNTIEDTKRELAVDGN